MVRLHFSSLFAAFLLCSTSFAQGFKGEESTPTCLWNGFYVGFNLGFLNHTMNITDVQATSFLATIEQVSNPRFSGGLQIGYRHQMDLNRVAAVYGLELSVNYSNAKYSRELGSPFATYQLRSEHEITALGLLELIGGIAVDRTFVFLAAGMSWVNISGTTTNLDSIAFFNSFSVSKKEFGTALGGGIEYALDKQLSVRFKVDVLTPRTYSVSDNVGDSFHVSNSIVQGTFGMNYKFA